MQIGKGLGAAQDLSGVTSSWMMDFHGEMEGRGNALCSPCSLHWVVPESRMTSALRALGKALRYMS